jgi:hypothetical protein
MTAFQANTFQASMFRLIVGVVRGVFQKNAFRRAAFQLKPKKR